MIARPDGTPTYNFCVVVDDLDLRITHVVRGDDHVNNTPRQINIIRALGAEPPVYAHVPTVLGEDGQKLSKRHGAIGVMQYEELGYLPDAMVNFLARLGWGHGDDEVFARDQFVAWFDLDAINPAPSRFNADKLRWLNQEHMKRLSEDELGRRLAPYLIRAGLDPAAGPAPGAVGALVRDRVATFAEMADAAHYFYAAPHASAERLAEHVNAGESSRAGGARRGVRGDAMDEGSARRRDEGRRRAARDQAGTGDDGVARARLRHARDAGHRRRARSAGARSGPRAPCRLFTLHASCRMRISGTCRPCPSSCSSPAASFPRSGRASPPPR